MRTALTSVLLFVIFGVAPAAAETGLLPAFKQLCGSGLADTDAGAANATAGGWEAVTPNADPQLQKVMALAQASKMKPTRIRSFGKKNADSQLFAVLSSVEVQSRALNTCNVYDFNAKTSVATTAVDAWLGAAATDTRDKTGIVGTRWLRPGSLPGYLVINSKYFTPDGEAATQIGLSGASLTATALVQK